MPEIDVYLRECEYVRHIGESTIELIDEANAWDFRLTTNESSVIETFYHIVRAIIEEGASDFNGVKMPYEKVKSPMQDWNRAIDVFIQGIENFTDDRIAEKFESFWCNETTIGRAISLVIFHTIGHLAQIRERTGVFLRNN